MALFDPADFIQRLGIDPTQGEEDYITGFLVLIEKYLIQNDINFGTDVTTKQLQTFTDPVNIYPTKNVRQISLVERKMYGSSDGVTALNENVDYILQQKAGHEGIAYEIWLLNQCLSLPYYLEVTGKWSVADEVDNGIIMAILELLRTGLTGLRSDSKLMENNGMEFASSKTGDTTVTFAKGQSSKSFNRESLFNNSTLKIIIDNLI